MAKTNGLRTYIAIASIIITLALALAGALKAYYVLPVQVARQAKDTEDLKNQIDASEAINMELRVEMAELKTEIKYLREDTKQILIFVREMRK